MILNCNGSGTIKSQPGFEADSDLIIPEIINQLHKMDIRTEVIEHRIFFRKKFEEYRRRDQGILSNLLWEGEIRLIQLERNKIQLDWKVNIGPTLFTTFLFGVISGTISSLFPEILLLFSILIGLATWLGLFIIFRNSTIGQMEDLLEVCCTPIPDVQPAES